jgi:hypothetical protein
MPDIKPYLKWIFIALLVFAGLVLLQEMHRFHAENLRAVSPFGAVIWRDGKLPSAEPETLTFTRSVEAGRRQEMRLFAWSLGGGRLDLNGAPLADLPPDRAVFFRVERSAMREVNVFSAVIPSAGGTGGFWLSEMSGFGTDASWTCLKNGTSLPLRVWGRPPLYPWKALDKK